MKISKVLTILIAIGVSLGVSGCNNAHTKLGSVIGGVGGGLLGSNVGQGKGQLIATGVGALLGAASGGYLGSFFDGVNNNTQSISQLQLEQMKLRQKGSSTMVFPMGQSHSHGGGYYNHTSVSPHSPYSCSVRNNYIVCNSR